MEPEVGKVCLNHVENSECQASHSGFHCADEDVKAFEKVI